MLNSVDWRWFREASERTVLIRVNNNMAAHTRYSLHHVQIEVWSRDRPTTLFGKRRDQQPPGGSGDTLMGRCSRRSFQDHYSGLWDFIPVSRLKPLRLLEAQRWNQGWSYLIFIITMVFEGRDAHHVSRTSVSLGRGGGAQLQEHPTQRDPH